MSTRAATFTVTTTAAGGAGSLSNAIIQANAPGTHTIAFNILPTGATVHYLVPPLDGFPLITNDNVTIDGTTQTGWVKNTAAITNCNNAAIKIALDARPPNANFRDMAYVYYGTVDVPPSNPVIDNTAMYGDGGDAGGTGRERGGYDPASGPPTYATGEKAILGIYRATNVTVKGIAFLSDAGDGYGLAIAQDFGGNTAILDRLAYDDGTCRGFHLAGCVFGIDPGTGADALSQNAVAMFRHRDRNGLSAAARRPLSIDATPDNDTVPNGENFVIGVAPGSADPRAEFNVFKCTELAIAAEGIHTRLSGNQFHNPPEFGRSSDDSDNPSILYGTDGDGVNDADEGNLFDNTVLLISQYNTRDKLFVFAGNTFGVTCAGVRTASLNNAVDEFAFSQLTRVRFGSDFNGVSDALEGNKVYDTLMFSFSSSTTESNRAWISMRGNTLVNNSVRPPLGDGSVAFEGENVYTNFMNVPVIPVITALTTTSLSGSCGTPVGAPYTALIVDLYESDPEGGAAGFPQGKTYRGSFVDNGLLDSNPAVGAFTFNITGAGILTGTTNTLTVTYAKGVTITSVSHDPLLCTTTLNYPLGNYTVESATSVLGPWTTAGAATGSSTTIIAQCGDTVFYRLVSTSGSGGGQTSPFADSVVAAP
ncbi:MAG: hypothetical protein HY298_06190 [Verrucomicrobia bacterium]|nr:hypothetical protein [Verrucomicrobiota bacterium]